MPPQNSRSLCLYRHALRYLRSPNLPFPYLSSKLCYNTRELFEIYRYEQDQRKVNNLIEWGWQDLEFLKSWKHVEKDLLNKIFRGFGNSASLNITTEVKESSSDDKN
ncbi:8900_t:CDS:1 [Acaulospora morrowiae]|uniref:8900_t:CDS:1 n=1 Tax=Acaulospora morrowiae TaxID=94023 RepID=A0A9N9GT28_9GLOM|nr:8900_t:CDS:1 [Acaulospora morrowiae]